MVSIFGMSEKVGNVSFYDSSGQNEYGFTKPYSEKTAELIDSESKLLIETQYVRALEVLNANKEGHEKLAELLLEKEVIFSEDLENVFGKRKWGKPLMVTDAKKEIAEGLLENNEAPAESEPIAE
jgi:cell division protease FtsH